MYPRFSIVFLLGNTVKILARKAAARFEQEDIPINLQQHYLLNVINSQDEVNQSELAVMLERDKSAVLRHIDQLEDMGFVSREPDAQDRRRKNIVITEAGKELLGQTAPLLNETMEGMLEGVSEADVKKFREVLTHLQNNPLEAPSF